MRRMVSQADRAVRAVQTPESPGMSTLVFLVTERDRAVWAHVGDSRLYHFRNGQMIFHTLDHSVPQTAVYMGMITEDQIRFHPDRSRILRALGSDSFEPDVMDHAAFGVHILFEEGLLRRFIKKDDGDGIIRAAIAKHSDFKLEGITDERALLHAKIIRDADKLDNCRVKIADAVETIIGVTEEQVGGEEISPEVMEQFNVIVIYESTPVRYHEDGTPFTVYETDWSVILDSGKTGSSGGVHPNEENYNAENTDKDSSDAFYPEEEGGGEG